MSIEKLLYPILNPNNLGRGETRTEEMNEDRWDIDVDPVAGEEVGLTLAQKADQKEKIDDKEFKRVVASPEETQEKINGWKERLLEYAKADPTRLAAKDRWPDAVREAGKEVIRKWP